MKTRQNHFSLIGHVIADANPEILSLTVAAMDEEIQRQNRHNDLLKKGKLNLNLNNTLPTLKRSS